jgi:hypothetical protein
MKKLLLASTALLLGISSAFATVTTIPLNVTVPGSGTPFAFLNNSLTGQDMPIVGIGDGINIMSVVPLGTATEPFSIPVTPSLTARSVDPCYLQKKTFVTVTSSNTALTQLVPLANLYTIYICSILVKPNAATAFSLVEGTGSNCASVPQAAVLGSLTAASGVPMSGIGDGFAMGNGTGTVFAIANPGNALCFGQSVAEAVSITLGFVQTPL